MFKGDLKTCKNNVTKYENHLLVLLERKLNNLNKVTGTTSNLSSVMVSRTNISNDKFILYLIKDEKLDDEIEQTKLAYKFWLELYNSEVDRMLKYDDINLIEFLKEDLDMKWEDIDSFLHYGTDTARKKYSRYKENLIKKTKKK